MRGRVAQRGLRDCATRYASIADVLRGYRGFTVLDLGAHTGYFSFRLAEEFGAECLAVDPSPLLVRAAERNANRRVRVLPRALGAAELEALGTFEVVLALSVLHHMQDWADAYRVLKENSTLFVEVPHPEEVLPRAKADLADLAAVVKGTVLCLTPGYDSRFLRPLYLAHDRAGFHREWERLEVSAQRRDPDRRSSGVPALSGELERPPGAPLPAAEAPSRR